MPSSTNGTTFWRHERRSPRARRIDARYRASGRRAAPPARTVVRPVAAVVDRAGGGTVIATVHGAVEEHLVERASVASSGGTAAGPGRRRRRARGRGRRRRRSVDLDEAVDRRRREPAAARRGHELVAGRPDLDGARGPCAGAATRWAPARTSRPASIITTWSHTRCTSSSRWVAMSDRDAERSEAGDEGEHLLAARAGRARPSARRAARARDRRRGPGPAWCAGACRSRSRRSGGTGPRRARRGRGCRTPAGGRRGRQAAELAERGDHVRGGLVEREAVVLGHEPEPARTPIGSAATSTPATSMRPAVGWARPSRSRNSVVLPAPLAPTRPTAPRGTSMVRSSRAVTRR